MRKEKGQEKKGKEKREEVKREEERSKTKLKNKKQENARTGQNRLWKHGHGVAKCLEPCKPGLCKIFRAWVNFLT